MTGKRIEILMVEDDPADADLTVEALKEGKILTNVSIVEDGVKALAYLRKEDPYTDAVQPDLIFLDLNLPKKDGREVLEELKQDVNLKLIPIVILTTSDAEVDIIKTYGKGANCYITKPVGFDKFTEVIKAIENFWFTIVKLPPKE